MFILLAMSGRVSVQATDPDYAYCESTGSSMMSFKLDKEGKTSIDLDRFPSGLYFAQILDQNQVLYSEKLPIQQ
jgi:hypothetical protein